MKIALVQINPLIGDFAANSEKMLFWAAKARQKGCQLVLFPELALSGYPPQDLLERPSYLRDHLSALQQFARQCSDIRVILGIIEEHSGSSGYPIHNSAALIDNGRIVFTARKRLLPTYDVFDERRYFEPGRKSMIFQLDDVNLAVTVCEDIWNDGENAARRLYDVDPVAELLDDSCRRPDILINISASPYHLNKGKLREEIFSRLCRKHSLPLLYVNQVGGQDSLLFDGHSLAIDSSGQLLGRGPFFEEGLLLAEWREGELHCHDQQSEPIPGEEGQLFRALSVGTRDYVTKCGFRQAVIGLSGGIDSALTAAIASTALGAENVLGVAMPSLYSSKESVKDAEQLANNLGIDFAVLPITDIFIAFQKTLSPLFLEFTTGIAEQNIQARIRGMLLMALSNKFNRLLLSTGNKSELAVGYCTLYGDMNGGLAVISDLPKQLVYRLASFINKERPLIPQRTIEKVPSAELAPDQKDQDDLPPYEILDAIVTAYLENNESPAEICARGFSEKIVADLVRRIKRNEYKRKQAPPGLRVTSKAFGYGRRYPTAENYIEQS
jgi:NAD+ synthase (glutamine-hydrolysing)